MAIKVNWTLNIQVPGGPKISDSRIVEVDAYDLIELTVQDGAADVEVGLQPGNKGVKMLVMKSDQYDGTKLTYKISDGAASSGSIALDGPHLLFSEAVVGLLGKAPVKALFSNSLGKPAAVQILVGRDATP